MSKRPAKPEKYSFPTDGYPNGRMLIDIDDKDGIQRFVRRGRRLAVILPDVNVLVYAFREGADRHADYARWLAEAINDTEPILLADAALSGFVRIVTDPRVSRPASTTASAFTFVRALLDAPPARPVSSSRHSWDVFDKIIQGDLRIKGQAISDGYLASLAVAHGARIATRDRGFGRFGKQLRWFDPADE